MDLDNFIIGKTKERRGEGRFGKKQQLLNKHRAAADGKNSQKTGHPSFMANNYGQQFKFFSELTFTSWTIASSQTQSYKLLKLQTEINY